MTREEVTRFLARRQEHWRNHAADALARDHSEDCVVDSPAAGRVKGRVAIEKVYRSFFASFPDLAFDQLDFVVEGDRVVEIARMSGTNEGGFMDLPPTFKKVSFPLVVILRLKDGQIVEEQRVYDFTGLLIQAGVLKARLS